MSSPKKMQLLALVTTVLARENVRMLDHPIRVRYYSAHKMPAGFRVAIPVRSSWFDSSWVNASETLDRMAEWSKGSFDVKSVLNTRANPWLFAVGSSFNSCPFIVYFGWNICGALIRILSVQKQIAPTSFAMAWREKWFSGACSNSLICCSDDTQICKLPGVATVKAAPSAWHIVSCGIQIYHSVLALDLHVLRLDLARATPKVSERRIPLVSPGDEFWWQLTHLLCKFRFWRKSWNITWSPTYFEAMICLKQALH